MATLRPIAAILLGFSAAASTAAAADMTCFLVEPEAVMVDGLLDEWRQIAGVEGSGESAADARAEVKCAHDRVTLYLAVDVRDDRLIRRKKPSGPEDHVTLGFGTARLSIYPADATSGAAQAVKWSTGQPVRSLAAVTSLRPRGWSIELGVPLAQVPGWRKGVPALPFTLELADADMLTEKRHQETVPVAGERLEFEEAAVLFRQLVEELGLAPADLRLDVMADMDGEPGAERVVAGGRIAAILGSEYSYIRLPVARASDVLEVRVVDLAGEGKSVILARYVERGNGGSREVLAVWTLNPDGSFTRTFAHELGKELGAARISSEWELVPRAQGRGKKPAAGSDLVIRAGQAVGASAETWNETPAEDMVPILLPWSDKRQETWRFRGNEVYGGE